MKTIGLSLAALAVLQLVAAQPHHARHQRRHPYRKVVTQTEVVTQPAIRVVVVVDQQGNPITTRTEDITPPTDAPAPNYGQAPPSAPEPSPTADQAPADQYAPPPAESASPSSEEAPAPSPEVSATYEPSAPPAPAPAPESSSESPAPSSEPSPAPEPPSSAPASGYGISYSPYNADGTCKTKDQVDEDFKKIEGWALVRIYGTDCNQLETVIPAAKAKGMRIFAGMSSQNVLGGKIQEDVEAFARTCGDSWDIIDTISVGNELVNSGTAPSVAVGAVNSAREALRAKGYNGPVVSVDTFVAIKRHPEICQNSDYAAANIHAFFDGGVDASGAGSFVSDQAKQVSEVCGGKKVVVTETGWPNAGGTNKMAVPGPDTQQAALSSIKQNFSSNPSGVILFTAFNDLWKKDFEGTFGCEKHWGFLG